MGKPLVVMVGYCGKLARARWPWLVAALILAIHSLVEYAGGAEQIASVYLSLGLRRDEVLNGCLWQVITYACLHGNWLHVLINALCILVLGHRVEFLLGSGGFLKTLAAGITGGALGHLLLSDAGMHAAPLVGISGACMAMLLVITTLSPGARMFPLPVTGRSLGLGILLAELLFALANPKLGLPGVAQIGQALAAHGMASWFMLGHACHVGGGVAGVMYAMWLLRPGPTLASLRRDRERREAKQQRN